MKRQRYHSDNLVRFSPRISVRLRKAVTAIADRAQMPESEVVRYTMETAILLVARKRLRLTAVPGGDLDAMVTMRMSPDAGRRMAKLHHNQYSHLLHADVLRRLLHAILPIARAKGMAHVMELREKNLP